MSLHRPRTFLSQMGAQVVSRLEMAVKLAYGRGAGAGIGTRAGFAGGMHRRTVEFEIGVNAARMGIYVFSAQIGLAGVGPLVYLLQTNSPYA